MAVKVRVLAVNLWFPKDVVVVPAELLAFEWPLGVPLASPLLYVGLVTHGSLFNARRINASTGQGSRSPCCMDLG